MIVLPTSQAELPAVTSIEVVAGGFEAIFVRMMLKSMRDASPGDGLFDNEGSRTFRDMQDSLVAEAVAQRGILGLSRRIGDLSA